MLIQLHSRPCLGVLRLVAILVSQSTWISAAASLRKSVEYPVSIMSLLAVSKVGCRFGPGEPASKDTDQVTVGKTLARLHPCLYHHCSVHTMITAAFCWSLWIIKQKFALMRPHSTTIIIVDHSSLGQLSNKRWREHTDSCACATTGSTCTHGIASCRNIYIYLNYIYL